MVDNVRPLITPDRQRKATQTAASLRALANMMEKGTLLADRAVILIECGGALNVHLAGEICSAPYLVGLLAMATANAGRRAPEPMNEVDPG